MGVMDRYNKKKKQDEEESQKESSLGGVQSRFELNKTLGSANHEVNEAFINKFLSDANNFLGSAEEEIGTVGWVNASSTYDTRYNAWKDLYSRSNSISRWLDENRGNLTEDSYKSLSSNLNSFRTGSSSVIDSFKSAVDYYSQWETEDAYNAWYEKAKKQEEERAAVLGANDFKEYLQRGKETGSDTHFETIGWENDSLNLFTNLNNDYIIAYREDPSLYAKNFSTTNMSAYADKDAQYAQYMTDDEYNTYAYYYGKYGKEKAREYLSSIEETLNGRIAGTLVESVGDNTATKMLFGVVAGLDQFRSGIESLFSKEDHIVSSPTHMASAEIRNSLSDTGATLPDWMGGGSLGQMGYDMVTTTSNMLPSILTSSVANVLAPGSGAIIGAGLLGASASGNAYAEMLNLGYDKGQARAYSILVGASEATLQYALGGFSKLGGKVTGNVISKFVSQFDNAIARTAIKLGGNMLSEGLEELIQSVLEPIFKSITTGEKFEGIAWDEVIYSGLMGALSAGILEGGTTISGEVSTYKQGAALKETGTESVDRLVSLGQTFSADSVAYQLAGKVNENTGAYTIGRLLNEVGASLSEQNKTDIAKALEDKGMTEKDAKTISKWLGKAVDGGYFSRGQIAALESNEVISSVFQDVIINQNSTVNQRIQGYNESIHSLAEEMSRGNATKATAEPAEVQQTSSEPTAMLSNEEYVRRIAEATGLDATAVAQGFARKAEASPVTENTPVGQIATEGKFEASETGKAKLGDTEVAIKEIASVKDGEITLRLEDGSTVNANDVEYGSSADALIYENVADMNLNAATANAFVKGYDPSEGLSAQEYVLGFREAYRYGEYGFPVQEMSKNGFSAKLSQTQRSLAYDLGKTDMKYKVAEQQKAKIASTSAINSEKIASTGAKKGKGHYAEGISTKGMTQRQKASLKGLEKLAEALGVEFHIFESEVGEDGKRKGANGWFDPKDGSIHIDLHAGLKGEGTILFTASHELTHFIREWSPEKFKGFADFLLEQYGKKGISVDALVRNQIAKAKRNGRDIDFDTAYEEVIADSCESMLADGEIMQKLAELKAKDKTLWEKIKSFIADLVAKIKAAYEGLSPDSIEGRFVGEMLDAATNLKTLFTDALVDAGENYSEIREALGDGSVIEVNENGEFTVGKTKDGDLLFNDRTYDEGGRETLRATLEAEGYSDADIDAALAIIDGKHELVKRFGEVYKQQDIVNKATLTTDLKNGNAVLSAIVSNGDYPVNIDLSMVCKKRVAYQNVINRLCQSGLINQATIDSLAIAEINKVLGKYGFETACLGCFVESRRIRIQEWAQTICKEWNGIVDKMVGKGNAESFGFANETFVKDLSNAEVNALSTELDAAYERDGLHYGRTTVVKKMEQLLREVPSLRKHLSVADLITPTGRTHIKSLSSELNSLIACRYGSNTPKIVQDFNPYNHELAQYGKVPKGYNSLREYLYAIGGARMQSFSDFIVENWFDYCQIVADLAARKLPMHTYTKEISLAKLFGMTGIKVNMSLIPDIDRSIGKEYAGLTKNANGEYELIFADKDRFKATGGKSYMQSINFADAVALQQDPRYSSNVGTIAVGISDNHIRMMLGDSRIRMVIPYHSSGMNPIFAHLVGTDYYKDYTTFQNTGVEYLIDSKGSKRQRKLSKTATGKLTSGFEFNKVLQELGDARAAAQAYLDWCADASKHTITINGETYTAVLKPKFDQFADHENYYKLLEDFNAYDSITEKAAPQGDVQQIYPEDFDSILEDEIRSRDNYRKKQEPKWESAMGEIEGYLKSHKKADTIAYAKEHGIKLSKKDMKLSDRDSDGNTLSDGQQEFFKDSKVRDADGNLRVVYHGTPKKFTTEKEVFNKILRELGYDGIIAYGSNSIDGYEIVAFNESQPKLTTNKTPTSDPDIRFSDRNTDSLSSLESQVSERTDEVVAQLAKRSKKYKALAEKRDSLGKFTEKEFNSYYHAHKFLRGETEAEILEKVESIKKHGFKSYSAVNFASANNDNSNIMLVGYRPFKGETVLLIPDHWTKKNENYILNGYKPLPYEVIKVEYNSQPYYEAYSKAYDEYFGIEGEPYIVNKYRDYGYDELVKMRRDILDEMQANGTFMDFKNEGWKKADEISRHLMRYFDKNGVKYSDRDTDSVSNRSLLANALESTIDTSTQDGQNTLEKLQEYKGIISEIEKLEVERHGIVEKATELQRKKGKTQEEIKEMKDLWFESKQIANRINTYDGQLLRIEAMKPIQKLLYREKKMAYQRAAQKGREALDRYREKATKNQRELLTRYQDSRKKGVEGRRKTEMRHKIKDVVNELNQYLKNTKEKHVPIGLQKPVAEALAAVNMDTVGAAERIAKLEADLMKAKTPDAIREISRKIDNIREMGERMDGKLQALKDAYDDIVNSTDPMVANAHDEVISNSIARVIKEVGNTPLRDMSLSQLEEVYDMYRMVLTTIRNTNKAFKVAKGEEISTIANGVIAELVDMKRKSPKQSKGMKALSEFDWNNLKPVYVFERIGSANFTKVFNAVRAGEDAWAVDITEAKDFSQEQRKKYQYDSWDFKKKYGFETKTGEKFELDLGEIMSLYAYSKDEHSKGHLTGDGFVFDPKKEVVQQTKSGIKVTYNIEDATSYNISEEMLGRIIGKLTPEQKAFTDAMQEYLSTVMGEKGNEVSLALYDIKLFKKKNYFPLKVSHAYMAVAKEKASGDVKIKNKGFTKERKEGAKNPIVLTPFMDVWADHVNEMSMYHAFTLPLEDFYRVFNYKAPGVSDFAPVSVNSELINAHGNAAVNYIEQLLKDLNGGARVDPTVGIINKMTGLFKKSAVFASASVVIQQPSAIARATALVDTKYFVGKPAKGKHREIWAEVKKYAPVAVIKEMGYFDTGMGQSTLEWIKDEKTLMDKVDDIASKAPALADEYAWCVIWNAVKRETLHTYKHLAPNSDAFLKAVGERFTEVITKTQVYDSVLARSANMRSKDTGMKMATAFMGEPTTSLNMIEDALMQGKRGNKRYARKAIGAVAASMILNSILVSFVYAGRDDDEDKTYTEKYIGTLTEELLDSFNPLTLIPFVKDIVSIVQGYDVERSDMAVITDIVKAWKNLGNDNRTVYRKVEDFAGAIASIFGLPVKNIMRDARAMYNTVNSFINGENTTGEGIKNALAEAVTGKAKTDGQQLYEAMVNGDTEQIERVKGRFKDDKAITSAIRTALRDNDTRIHDAAVARYEGNIAEYTRIAREIIAEGNFKQDDIVAAINAEINALKKGEGTTASTADSNKATSIYKVEDYFTAIVGRDQASAYVVKEDIIKTAMANGKDRDEAEADFNSSFASHLRDQYEAGNLTDYEAINMLVEYGGRTQDGAEAKAQYWAFKKKYPDYDLSEDAVTKYYSDVEPSGIDVAVYYDYYKQRAKCKGVDLNGDGKTDSGSVKSEVLEVINSLPISYSQKDVLYYLNGWSASTIWEAPWH